MSSGWVSLYRKLQTHWIWDDPEMFRAWVCILFQVNHAPAKIVIKGCPMECARGQSLNSLETWGRLFGGWSKNRVSRFFTHLKNDAMIELECNNKTTRLTVCNYETYQDSRDADGTQTDTQTERRRTTNNKKNNDNKENNDKGEAVPAQTQKQTIEERIRSFGESLRGYTETYSRDMLEAFYRYWIEPNAKRTKTRWEMEKTWDTSLRLANWASREEKYSRGKNTALTQDAELEQLYNNLIGEGKSHEEAEAYISGVYPEWKGLK